MLIISKLDIKVTLIGIFQELFQLKNLHEHTFTLVAFWKGRLRPVCLVAVR